MRIIQLLLLFKEHSNFNDMSTMFFYLTDLQDLLLNRDKDYSGQVL
jgi:hypothetical protein